MLQVQFVAIMVHAFQLLFIDCNYPRAFVWWIGLHAVMFFFLFNEFYKSTYKYNSFNYNAVSNTRGILVQRQSDYVSKIDRS